MKRSKIVLVLSVMVFLFLIPGMVYSQGKKSYVLVGLALGEPTSVQGRWQINPNHGIQVDLGATLISPFYNNTDPDKVYDPKMIKVNLSAIYVFNMFLTREWNFPLYIGAGINFKFESNVITRFGIKLPVLGIEYIFRYGPIKWGVFFETGIVTNLTPEGQNIIDWFKSFNDKKMNTMKIFRQAFDIHFTIGVRCYIPT